MSRAIVILSVLLGLILGFGIHGNADNSNGFSLIIQKAGTTQGGAVTLNLSTGTSVALSGGVATVTATGTATPITFGTYASLPISPSGLYQTTDSPYTFIASGGTWTAFMPPWGLVVPPGTLTMSTVNASTSSFTTTNGVQYLAQAAGAGSSHNWTLRTLAIPSASNPYTITAVIQFRNMSRVTTVNNRGGIAIYDSVSGKFIDIDFGFASSSECPMSGSGLCQMTVNNWTNTTTYGGTTYATVAWDGNSGASAAFFGFPATVVLQIQNDGTNVTYRARDQFDPLFTQIFQHAKNTFVTPTSVAFGISNFSQQIDMNVYSFSLTQP